MVQPITDTPGVAGQLLSTRGGMDKQFLHDITIAGGGLLAVLPLAAYAMREKGKRWLLPLIELFDGQMGELKGTFDWMLKGRFKHRPVTMAIRSIGMYGARSVRFEVLCAAEMRFAIYREHAILSIRRLLGTSRDIEVGDEFLDGEYVFRASDPARFAPWVRQQEVRRRVEELFDDRGMEYVLAGSGRLCCGYQTGHPRAPLMAEVHLTLEALTALAESLESQHQEHWFMDEPTASRRRES